jgi:DNA modification methylase
VAKKNLIKRAKSKRVLHYYANDNNFSKVNVESPILNEIICGDSLDVLKKLPDNCIDLTLTSPPYNFNREYNEYNDLQTNEKYFEELFEILKEVCRVTKYGGRVIINVMPLYSDFIPTHIMIGNFFMEQKFIWRDEIIWNKNNRNCAYSAWGSFRSSSSPYMKKLHEYILVFSKGSIKHEIKDHKYQDDMQKLEFSDWLKTGTWNIQPEMKQKKYDHPAMFPEELAYRCLKLFSGRGDTILDPFNGAGTTTKMAYQTKRNYIGIDIDENYCNTAKKRIKDTKIEEFKLEG